MIRNLLAPERGRRRLEREIRGFIEDAQRLYGGHGTLAGLIAADRAFYRTRPRRMLPTLLSSVVSGQVPLQALLRIVGDVEGGLPAVAQLALGSFLERYGMRGIAEIDLGRPRWGEDPAPVIATLQGYLEIDPASSPRTLFERAAARAGDAAQRLIAAVRARSGAGKARVVRALVRRIRALTGLRETPKFALVRMLAPLRTALLLHGRRLCAAGRLTAPDDLFFLHLHELESFEADAQA
ncbi:MAG: hypothetical protein ABIO70_24885, partial [Pseudomonadota bacterium]